MNKILNFLLLLIFLIILTVGIIFVINIFKEISDEIFNNNNNIETIATVKLAEDKVIENNAFAFVDSVEMQVMLNSVLDEKSFDLSKENVYNKSQLMALNVQPYNEVTSANVTINIKGEVIHACIVIDNKIVEYDGKNSSINADCVSQTLTN